jgi:hypothetical protein
MVHILVMANKPSIFDRLRSMQTEGLPLHTLIVEACEVGNELIAACEATDDFIVGLAGDIPLMDYCNADPEAGTVLLAIRGAVGRAYHDNSNGNGSNGSNRSAA